MELSNSAIGLPSLTKKEAEARGISYYSTGGPCPKGHLAKRRTSSGVCVACEYIRGLANLERTKRSKKLVKAQKHQEKQAQSLLDKERLLNVYAETGDLEKAASAVNLTLAELNVHMARLPALATQVYALEKRLKAQKQSDGDSYKVTEVVWTTAMHDLFIRAYVDTGNIAAARDAVKVSASNYFEELQQNEEFAAKVKDAHPKAAQALEEKAIQLALQGNDRLLGVVLKAKLPEYKDKIQIDQTNTTFLRIPDDQLNQRITLLMKKYSNVIEGEVLEPADEHESDGQGKALSIIGRTGSSPDPQPARVLLPGNRTSQ